MIVAAKKLGCHEIVTEDLNDGQAYCGMAAVNPFKAAVTCAMPTALTRFAACASRTARRRFPGGRTSKVPLQSSDSTIKPVCGFASKMGLSRGLAPKSYIGL